jgi:hypothetical protein
MSEYSPTDAEFLQLIYHELGDSEYVAEIRRFYEDESEREGQFKALVAAGVFKSDEAEAFRDMADETFSLERAFRGRFIDVLREMALTVMGPDHADVEQIPVGLLPTRELNASAIATPRGGVVIVLNHGLIAQLAYVCRCTLAFISWQSDDPFCREAPQGAYAAALVGLAEYVNTSDLNCLARHKVALRFPSLSDYDEMTYTVSQLAELFILLHEYGHVVRGHLQTDTLRPAFGVGLPDLQEYTNSEAQAFEADEYAIEQLLRSGRAAGLRPSDIAFGAGVVMKFFELCELVSRERPPTLPRTHPSASQRWARIKTQTGLHEARGALAGNLDPAFKAIRDRLAAPTVDGAS